MTKHGARYYARENSMDAAMRSANLFNTMSADAHQLTGDYKSEKLCPPIEIIDWTRPPTADTLLSQVGHNPLFR
jgi:hypothetical protein